MLQRALILLVLSSVILVSGCIGLGGGAAAGNGLAILAFEPDFPSIYSDEGVKLQLRVKNNGDVVAENIKAEIAGISLSEWGGGFGTFSQEQNLGRALPYDPATKTEGETKTAYWSLKAPKLPKGISYDYTPIVKVSYDYKTQAIQPITIVDEAELRRIMQQGKSLPSKTSTYTKGPLSVEVQTGNYVKTTSRFTAGTSYDIFPINVKIVNTNWEAGGTVLKDAWGFGGGWGRDFDYPIQVKITPATGTSFVYSGTWGEDCSSGLVTVDLWKGKEKIITCELRVNEKTSYSREAQLQVEVSYRYQVEGRTQVKVFGTETGGLWR